LKVLEKDVKRLVSKKRRLEGGRIPLPRRKIEKARRTKKGEKKKVEKRGGKLERGND